MFAGKGDSAESEIRVNKKVAAEFSNMGIGFAVFSDNLISWDGA
jgi:hypothetical protein